MTTYLLGIQWQSSSLHVALLKRASSGKSTVIRVDRLTFPSGDIAANLTIFKNWLKEHIPQNASVQAVLSVPESHVILKELELPVLRGQELAEAVHWELTGKSAIGQESATAWQIVERRVDTLRIATMIMKKTEVAAALSLFSEAGVELIAIEPSAISAGRALTLPETTSVLLSLEGAEASAVFVRAGVPVFSTSFTLPLTDAAIRGKHLPREAAAALISQLKKIISYWNAKEEQVEKIIVLGTAAGFTGLKSDVARGLSTPLTIGQVKSGMTIQDAVPIGAALRIAKTETEEVVNFLPKEQLLRLEKKAFEDYVRMRLWQFTKMNTLVLILVAFLSGFLWVSHLTYTKNITQTERAIASHPAQTYVAHIASVNAVLAQVATLMASQEDFGSRLRYVSSVTPPNVHFNSLKMVNGSKQEWAITGTGTRQDILAFYYKLKTDGFVREVTMPYTNFNRETDSPFTVIIVW